MQLVEIIKLGSYEKILSALEERKHDPVSLARALMEAVRLKNIRFVELLLEHGADPNLKLDDDWTPLGSAVEHEQFDIIKTLVEHGADINSADERGLTSLHHAIDLEGDAAHQASVAPSANLTTLLMSLGADPRIRDSLGRTPADIARNYSHIAALEALKVFPTRHVDGS